LAGVIRQVRAFFLGQPLKELKEFAGFPDQRHRKVLGGVRLYAVALGDELAERPLEPG
jgi:hypothetical protein